MLVRIAPRAERQADENLGFGLPETGMSRFGWSYYGTFRKCKRAWAFKYGPGKHDKPPRRAPGPRDIGTAVHAGLAAHYLGKMGRMALRPHDAVAAAGSRLSMTGHQIHRAQGAVQAYVRAFASEPFDPMHVEEEFWISFGPEWGGAGDGEVPYTARLDVVLRARGSGRIFIVDYKTGIQPDNATLDAYALHGQLYGQHWIGKLTWGERFGGVLVAQVQSDTPFRINRVPPPPAPLLLASFPRSIRNTAAEIAWWTESNGPDPLAYDGVMQETVCRGRYGFCDFREPCTGGTFR